MEPGRFFFIGVYPVHPRLSNEPVRPRRNGFLSSSPCLAFRTPPPSPRRPSAFIVLDSSVLIATEREEGPPSHLLASLSQELSEAEVLLSSITVMELEHGWHRGSSMPISLDADGKRPAYAVILPARGLDPRIENRETDTFKILGIAGHDGEVVRQRRCCQ